LGLAFLAALALIKARLIVKSTIAKSQFEVFQRFIEAENVAISLKSSPVVDKIRSYAIPCVSEKLEKQKQDFEDLLDLIDGENRIFLSAIINPEPLLSQVQFLQLFSTMFLVISGMITARSWIPLKIIVQISNSWDLSTTFYK
jgi:hypothetical protein